MVAAATIGGQWQLPGLGTDGGSCLVGYTSPMVAARLDSGAVPRLGMDELPMVAAAAIRWTVATAQVGYGQVTNGGSCHYQPNHASCHHQ